MSAGLRCLLTAASLAVAAGQPVRAQHLHFVVGAETPTPGAKLIAVNSNEFVTASGYVRSHALSTNGVYDGYHHASHPFIVAAATEPYGGPEAGAPALGALIRMRIVSVSGPTGGSLSFWETDATAPTISVVVGETNLTSWHISENDGSPGSDPYGHIHGRRFAMTKPGFYVVGFQFFDASTNGVNGGPIHAPSEIVSVNMQADVTITSLGKGPGECTITFGAPAGMSCVLEAMDAWAQESSWREVAGPITGDDHLQALIDPAPLSGQRFYRIKVVVP